MQRYRLNPDQLNSYYIRTAGGVAVPVSTVVNLQTEVVPESLNHFQQLNAATISAVPMPGVTLGQALDTLKTLAAQELPQGYSIDYSGQSRQFEHESSQLMVTFFFALIIIFLALAALFESFRDPLIILVSVPMSICGAMIFISLGIGGATLNIYTEVGLVTLIGLISKHGILIVQFANDLQAEGKSKREAIETAAGIRLRPILMTTAAMVLGVLPLVLATGAGAVGRFNMGLVIMTGLSIGTLFHPLCGAGHVHASGQGACRPAAVRGFLITFGRIVPMEFKTNLTAAIFRRMTAYPFIEENRCQRNNP